MAKGNYLVRGDKTTCGGFITEGCEDHCLFGKAIAREGDKVTCGQHPGMYNIVGGIANDSVHGRRMAGTLDSYSTCPCRARFTASMVDDTYEKGSATSTSTSTSTSASSPDSPATALQGSNKNLNDENDAKHEHHCIHTDGAVQVASYILEEIKKNVRGDIAQNIRYFIDDETLSSDKRKTIQILLPQV